MLSFSELNKTWARALREHATTQIQGDDGPYRPIGDRTLEFLDGLWKARKAPLPDLGAMIEEGKVVRFYSDPHFFHANILKLANRVEFRDVEEMDRVIWDNVERAVSESDMVVCLGDLALKNPLAVLRRMASSFGNRHQVIPGNHDPKGAGPAAWAASGAVASLAFSLPLGLLRTWAEADHGDLAELVDWKELPRRVNLGCSHWPLPADRMPGPAWLCLHGHTHRRHAGPLWMNCSVEAIGYQPKTLREMMTPDLLDDLVRRQGGLSILQTALDRMPGDADCRTNSPGM